MKILAIESSSLVASAAIYEDGKLTAEYDTDYRKTHSETLLPMLSEIVRATDTELRSLDAIAVSAGPGSFTGLRIGAATAKGLGLALDIPIVPVPTLQALAYNMAGSDALICPIMDAKRQQVYTGLYRVSDEVETVMEQCAMGIEELISIIRERYPDEKIIFLGDGVPVAEGMIADRLPDAHFAQPHLIRQKAGSVAVLGARYYAQGRTERADDFAPVYLRQSQAEREYTTVRKAGIDEAKLVAELEKQVFADAWTEADVRSLLNNKCYEALIAYHDDMPCGYLLCQKVSGDGELLRIATLPAMRRAGIARRLMSVMEDDKNTDMWSLEVRAGNAAAIALYESMGYMHTRVRQDYYKNPVEDALIMEKRIRE